MHKAVTHPRIRAGLLVIVPQAVRCTPVPPHQPRSQHRPLMHVHPAAPCCAAFDANNTVRVGDSVAAGLTGVLLYQFSLWRIQPIASTLSIVKTNPRPPSPPDVLAGG